MHNQTPTSRNNHKHKHLSCKNTHNATIKKRTIQSITFLVVVVLPHLPSTSVLMDTHKHMNQRVKELNDTWYSMSFSACTLSSSLDSLKNLGNEKTHFRQYWLQNIVLIALIIVDRYNTVLTWQIPSGQHCRCQIRHRGSCARMMDCTPHAAKQPEMVLFSLNNPNCMPS